MTPQKEVESVKVANPGKSFSDITDIGIATSSSAFYVWYTDEKCLLDMMQVI